MKRFIIIFLISILLAACGVKGRPTGGELDLEKPQVISSVPAALGQITGHTIEIDFSKAMDKGSLPNAIYIYPPVLKKTFSISRQSLKIEFKEPLLDDTFYYVTLTKSLKDLRGNPLNKNHTLVYKHGEPSAAQLSGLIHYEDSADSAFPIQFSLFSADTLLVMQDELSGSAYELPPLLPGGYQLRAYIDKNLNGRYDESQEAFFEQTLMLEGLNSLDLEMAYTDTTWAQIRRVMAHSAHELEIGFSKAITGYSHFVITDSDTARVEILHEHLEGDKLRLLVNKLESGEYRVQMQNLEDIKGNTSPASALSFMVGEIKDSSPPRLLGSSPRSGTTVNNLSPVLRLDFNKIMPRKGLMLSLTEANTSRQIPLEIQATKGRSPVAARVSTEGSSRTSS